ncbi:MAG: hypothetical protein ACMXYL_05690 [Candidatus Woesearchaeota archaeon]
MNKKAQGLPLNTIIIAIIVIVVLVVIILIFTGQIRIFQLGANPCVARGGFCTDDCPSDRAISQGNQYCVDHSAAGNICCRGLPGGGDTTGGLS